MTRNVLPSHERMNHDAPDISVENTVHVPISRVWHDWTTPADIKQWGVAFPRRSRAVIQGCFTPTDTIPCMMIR